MEETTLLLLIEKAIAKANSEPSSREMSLVITKLQEAKMWHREHMVEMNTKLMKAGYKPTA